MSGLDFSAAIAAVKATLGFGDVAAELGVPGSSREGWDCPSCGGPGTLKERPDHKGGRCRACDKGFDILGLVMDVESVGHGAGLRRLQDLASETPDPGSGDLFGGGRD